MRTFEAKPFPRIPTIAEMDNANDVLRVELTLLRALCTSDMAFRYMLLKPDSIRDIVRTSRAWLRDVTPEPRREGLSEAERREYTMLCDQLERYADTV